MNMKVQFEFIETTMMGSTSLSTMEDELNLLFHQVMINYGLEVYVNLLQIGAIGD